MNIINENTSRKLDNLGRVSLPKSMRDRLNIGAGEEVSFFMIEHDGVQYIACTKQKTTPEVDRKRIAADVLRELGYDLPEELE